MNGFFDYVAGAARDAGFDIDSPRGGGRTALAEAAEMTRSSVGRMLNRQTVPEARALPRLAVALNVPAEDLFRLAGITGTEPTETPGSHPLSAELFDKVRTLRRIYGVSAQELADRMTEQGFPVKRSVIANCENGRVSTLSVDFADHAARALGTTLIRLIEEPATCPQCKSEPPAGFTCNTCGVTA